MDLTVERPSHKEAILRWKSVYMATNYEITLEDLNAFFGSDSFYSVKDCYFYIPKLLEAGHKYRVLVTARREVDHEQDDIEKRAISKDAVEFRAVFTRAELQELLDKAKNFVRSDSCDKITYFYRNKSSYYFEDITSQHNGIMKPYIKDNNGDHASIINGQINGLFFASFLIGGSIPSRSPFGSVRFHMPALTALNQDGVRLYFADFYCINKWHYVTVVLTIDGSNTDKFCKSNLICMDLDQNEFLFRKDESVKVTKALHVEIFYTEDIDIKAWEEKGAYRRTMVSKGSSTPGGLPKRLNCSTCNLSPILRIKDFMEVCEELMKWISDNNITG